MTFPSTTRVTSNATLTLGAEGIFRALLSPLREHTLAHAQENTQARAEMVGERRCPMLVDQRQVQGFTREARAYYTSLESNRRTPAVALLVTSPVHRVVGNFFIAAVAGRVPARLFTSEVDAVAWLTEFLT